MAYIVMDLEFNYPETRYRSERNGVRLNEEITEIGAVKLDDDLNEVDRYQCYVKPTAYTKMNKKSRNGSFFIITVLFILCSYEMPLLNGC